MTNSDRVRALITGVGATPIEQAGLATARRVSAASTTCVRCQVKPRSGTDGWQGGFCAGCLTAEPARQATVVAVEFPQAGRCEKCGKLEPLGQWAVHGENPRWCGHCNFEFDAERKRRKDFERA